jgi:hypothetical protein
MVGWLQWLGKVRTFKIEESHKPTIRQVFPPLPRRFMNLQEKEASHFLSATLATWTYLADQIHLLVRGDKIGNIIRFASTRNKELGQTRN